MAAAKPVVAFTMPAYEAFINSKENGVLCGEASPHNLANAINELLDSPEMRMKMGEKARATAETYSWANITEQVLGYYKEIKVFGSSPSSKAVSG